MNLIKPKFEINNSFSFTMKENVTAVKIMTIEHVLLQKYDDESRQLIQSLSNMKMNMKLINF